MPPFLRRLVLLKPGELPGFLWSGAFFFCILFAYSLISPFRDEMGMRKLDKLALMWTGTLAATLVAASLYAWLVSRLPRRRFIPIAYSFFAVCLGAFYVAFVTLDAAANPWLGYAFYTWVSVFALFNTAIYRGLMADVYTPEQGKRLFGPIGVGGTLGSICGSSVPAILVRGVDVGGRHLHIPAVSLLLISIGFLVLAMLCAWRLFHMFGLMPGARAKPSSDECGECGYALEGLAAEEGHRTCPECGRRNPVLQRRPVEEPSPNPFAGITLMARSPYLLALCAYMLLFSMTSTFLNVEQLRIVGTFSDSDKRVASQATVTLCANVLTLVTQLFLTGRILSRVGLLFGLLLQPCIVAAAFAAMAISGSPMIVLIGAAASRGLHYGVDRPTREVLYTILGPDEKYKSKSFIDTVVYRTGDQVGVWTNQFVTQKGAGVLAGLVGALALIWAATGVALNSMNKRLSRR